MITMDKKELRKASTVIGKAFRKLNALKRVEVDKLGRKYGIDTRNHNYQCVINPSYHGGYTKADAIFDVINGMIDKEEIKLGDK
jgi:hypothetical protein